MLNGLPNEASHRWRSLSGTAVGRLWLCGQVRTILSNSLHRNLSVGRLVARSPETFRVSPPELPSNGKSHPSYAQFAACFATQVHAHAKTNGVFE